MPSYIKFDIENIEPIKVASTIMQSDNESSRSYIPGSALRGAFIVNYIKMNNLDANNLNTGEHREKLLKGGIQFLNAYPIIDGDRSMPMPKCFFANKHDMKAFGNTGRINIKLMEADNDEDLERVKAFDTVNLDFNLGIIKTAAVEKISNLHIKIDENKNRLFRYEAIKPGNKFRGYIKCNKESYEKEVQKILEEGLFYVGGSKGSGYGKCKISEVKIIENNPEIMAWEDADIISDESYEDAENLCIYAVSDIIYRDKLGVYKGYIDPEYIKEKLGLDDVEMAESFVGNEYFTGFNNKWGCKLPVVSGIQAGSILNYRFKGRISKEKALAFMEEGIGERKQDGFGRFIIIPDMKASLNFTGIKKVDKPHEVIIDRPAVPDNDRNQFDLIMKRIYFNKLKESIPKKVLELKVSGSLTKNQIGKLANLMDILLGMKQSEGVDRLTRYFEHIDNKKINRELANALSYLRINNIPIKKYLISELSNNDTAEFNARYAQGVNIRNIAIAREDEIQMMYTHKLKIFKYLFNLQLKDDGEGDDI